MTDTTVAPSPVAKPRTRKGQAEAFEAEEMGISGKNLRSFIERIERLEEEKGSIVQDIKEVFGEVKGAGFDAKAVRANIKLRKQDPDERREAEAILDLYMSAIGMA